MISSMPLLSVFYIKISNLIRRFLHIYLHHSGPRYVGVTEIAAAIKCPCDDPQARFGEYPHCDLRFIIKDMFRGEYGDARHNCATRSQLPHNLLLIDSVLKKNVSIGTQNTKDRRLVGCLVCFPKEILGRHSQINMEANVGKIWWINGYQVLYIDPFLSHASLPSSSWRAIFLFLRMPS